MRNGAQKARERRKQLFELKLMNAQTQWGSALSRPYLHHIDAHAFNEFDDTRHNPETQFRRSRQNHALGSWPQAPRSS